MRLRNKKTGKIIDAVMTDENEIEFQERGSLDRYTYSSLAELNEEWEDYEEPKDYYIINLWGEVCVEGGKYRRPGLSELGLTFETKEEAEKAVEKLKALKRLKDKGFRFVGWRGDVDKHHLDGVAWYEMRLCGGYNIETADDLKMIFGPEEKD